MHNIHIIGNGFDLAHGMNTSYDSLMQNYLYRALLNLDNDHLIETNIFHHGLHQFNYDKLKQLSLKDLIDLINPTTNSNMAVSKHPNRNKTTIYFENNFIYQVLLKTKNLNWVDIEQLYFDLLYKIAKNPVENTRISSIKKLNKDLDMLKEVLISYLNTLEPPTEIPELTTYINDNCQLPHLDAQHDDLFLNFNYTTTFQDIYLPKIRSRGKSIINVHGTLKDSKITFGHGDEISNRFKEIEDLNEDDFMKNIKSFDYLTNQNYKRILSTLDSTKGFKVFIYGHSCGISDRTLLNLIFENPRCESIKTLYYIKNNNDNFKEITYNISRNFNDKNLMRRRVVSKSESMPFPQKNG